MYVTVVKLPNPLKLKHVNGCYGWKTTPDARDSSPAGGKWPEAIRKVTVDACVTKEEDSQNILLLGDILDVIETNEKDNHISSGGLVSALVAMPDREAQAVRDTAENSSDWGNDGKGLRNNRFQRCTRTF
jgi:hypothetical protein